MLKTNAPSNKVVYDVVFLVMAGVFILKNPQISFLSDTIRKSNAFLLEIESANYYEPSFENLLADFLKGKIENSHFLFSDERLIDVSTRN